MDAADTAVGTAYLFSTQGPGDAFTARIEEPGAWRVDAGRRGATVLSEDGFTNAFTALTVDPFVGLDPSRRELPRLISAVQDCPLRPSYLR
jgi:hypothetical protein